MSDILPYLYAILWFLLAIGTFAFGKKNKLGAITVVASIMFIFMGIWWTIDALIPSVNLLKGTYGIIVRVVIAVFVLIMLFSNFPCFLPTNPCVLQNSTTIC